jgi:hypothetical protein
MMKRIFSLLFLCAIAACTQNPFGLDKAQYAGEGIILSAGSGYNFGERSMVEDDGEFVDFYYYEKDGNFYLGLGFNNNDAQAGDPDAEVIANIYSPASDYEEHTIPPEVGSGVYKGEQQVSAASISNEALFYIYTRDKHFALICVRSIVEDTADGYVQFDYIYNPDSGNDYNRSIY